MPLDNDKIELLYGRITGVLQKRYRPLDGIPFFRFIYPPELEKEALKEFRLLAGRLESNNYSSGTISLFAILKAALIELLNTNEEELPKKLEEYESTHSQNEMVRLFSEHLPQMVTEKLLTAISEYPGPSCLFLTRTGSLFPFVRLSSILSRLEGQTEQTIVALYPGDQEGAMLRDRSFDLAGGYYRGEIL